MAFGICDVGRTRLDYADVRAACRLSPAQIGLGNVESTPIGLILNGVKIEGALPTNIGRDRCSYPHLKPVPGPC